MQEINRPVEQVIESFDMLAVRQARQVLAGLVIPSADAWNTVTEVERAAGRQPEYALPETIGRADEARGEYLPDESLH